MSKSKFKQKPKKVKAERVQREPNLRLRGFIASFFNNRAAYDRGRIEKWWVATLLFIVSIIISLIPAMVNISKTSGSDTFNDKLFHTDVALVKFVERLEAENVDLRVVEDGDKRIFSQTGDFTAVAGTNVYTLTSGTATSDVPYFSYSQTIRVAEKDENDVITYKDIDFEYLRVYYTAHIETTFLDGTRLYEPESFLANKLLALSGDEAKGNVTSHLIIGRQAIFMRLYNPNDIGNPGSPYRNFEGRTSTLPVGLNLRDFGKKAVDGSALVPTDTEYSAKVVANFAKLQDDAYLEVKTQRFWLTTGLYAIIFTGIGLVMGLIIFIATRGKMNPNRDLKFFESFKVGAWLLPTPAIITLILGFILPETFFQTIFVMTLGMRSVWLTMRTLGPQAANK